MRDGLISCKVVAVIIIYYCYIIIVSAVVFVVVIWLSCLLFWSTHQANTTWNWIPWLWTTTECTSARWARESAAILPSGPGKRRWPSWCRRTVRGSRRVIKSTPRKTRRSNWSAYPKVENRTQRWVLWLFTHSNIQRNFHIT